MNINNVILLMTSCFSGISIIISALSLLMTRKNEKEKAYINNITASRENWADNLKSNGAQYLAIVDSIFSRKDCFVQKYEELLIYQYSISIAVFDYEDDRQIQIYMQEIQSIIYNSLIIKKSDPQIEKVNELKDKIFFILKQKYENEWKKKKYEISGNIYK